jgi:hypothetical protein
MAVTDKTMERWVVPRNKSPPFLTMTVMTAAAVGFFRESFF